MSQGHGRPTRHKPELILNHFNTQLGRRLGRMIACMFSPAPAFRGRQVATFHNQRDYIFFRQACLQLISPLWFILLLYKAKPMKQPSATCCNIHILFGSHGTLQLSPSVR